MNYSFSNSAPLQDKWRPFLRFLCAYFFLFFTDLWFWLSSHTSTKIPRVPQVLFSFCPPVRGIRGKAFDCSVRWRTLASFVCCLFNSWKQINTFSVAVTPQKFVFVFVWFLAGRKTRRLNNKSKQWNWLHGLFCCELICCAKRKSCLCQLIY